ncbi:serine hydrolase domain-containing protein [Stenotrophomonas sp. Iso1]|uniref:serine hydrolase domain-containing protein n=1 Tax=Stenotrophomonas sp. Iso1 TaxID=2977283 RepID=UPI0022B7AD8A|nr:serine hydrolase domain-containing protein [Stenotrophomonas sp. Iso1]
MPACIGLAVLLTGGVAAQPVTATPDVQCNTVVSNTLRPSALPMNAPLPYWSIQQRMAEHKVPGAAIAVIRDGKVAYACGYGLRQANGSEAVDADTLFSVGSVSKVVTAAATLREVAAGRLALDHSVNAYLRSWKIPASGTYNPDTITLRMLMSHTAGLTVWGFDDFQPGEALPTLLQTLDGIKPARNEPVRIDFAPGMRMRYSGGGVMVEQLVLQDTAGKSFEKIARESVFAPIGMHRSTFTNPLPATTTNVAHAHDNNGNAVALPTGWETFPEQAASGLWTNANELGAFVATLLSTYAGNSDFLPQPIAVAMMSEVAPSQHGLGPRLEGEGSTRIFHHGGSNDSYRAWIEGYPAHGDGFVILTNGANGGRLAAEIRNGLSDALGHGGNTVLRTITLPETALADFAGEYVLQTDLPREVGGNMIGYFEHDHLSVTLGPSGLALASADVTRQLQPLTPNRFINPAADASQPRYEFLRDTRGKVHALLVQRDGGRVYFRRLPTG